MKQRELQPCICCGKGMMHNNDLTFLRVRIEYLCVNPQAIQQQAGLEQVLGSPALAAVMGPDPNIAETVDGPHDVLVCMPCALQPEPLFAVLEAITRRDEAAEASP